MSLVKARIAPAKPQRAEFELTPVARRYLYPAATVALLFIALPILYIIERSLSGGIAGAQLVILRAKTLEIALTTIALTVLVVICASVLGITIGWALHNVKLPFQGYLQAFSILPMAIPSYVFSYCWLSLEIFGRGLAPTVFILTIGTAPYVILAVLAGLRRLDLAQLDVARTLGLNRFALLTRIVLPQIRNSFAAGALLVALCVVSDFGTVSLMGVDTFTRSIHNTYQGTFDRSSSATLALLLIALSAVIISIENRSRSSAESTRSSTAITKLPELIDRGALRSAALALISTYIFIALVLPLSVLAHRFFTRVNAIDFGALLSAAGLTILVSGIGALLALCLAIPIALLSVSGSWLGRFSDRGVLIIHALPGVVMGLALVAFGADIPWLYQTLPLLAISYALLFVAKSVGATRSAIARVPSNLLEMSATLGKSRAATFRQVALPLAAPGVLTGSLLVLLAAMKELPATLMLRPTGVETLATEMWSYTAISKFSEAAPYAFLLVIVAAIPTFLIGRPDRTGQSASDIQ